MATKKSVNPVLFDVIQRPIITEKSTLQGEQGKVSFEVSLDATKPQIKEAVEAIFDVKVTAVNTIKTKGKTKRFRGKLGKRSDSKKAIITLSEDSNFDAMGGVK